MENHKGEGDNRFLERRSFTRGCMRKVRYSCREKTEKRARKMVKSGLVFSYYYYCSYCSGWHVTKGFLSRKEKQRRKYLT